MSKSTQRLFKIPLLAYRDISKHDVNIVIHLEIVDAYLELNSSDLKDLKLIWES